MRDIHIEGIVGVHSEMHIVFESSYRKIRRGIDIDGA